MYVITNIVKIFSICLKGYVGGSCTLEIYRKRWKLWLETMPNFSIARLDCCCTLLCATYLAVVSWLRRSRGSDSEICIFSRSAFSRTRTISASNRCTAMAATNGPWRSARRKCGTAERTSVRSLPSPRSAKLSTWASWVRIYTRVALRN